MSEGKYYRKGHWVNRPKPKSAKGSGWLILAAVAALAWFWSQGAVEQQTTPQQPSSVSETVAPAQVPAAEQPADPDEEPPPPDPTEAP